MEEDIQDCTTAMLFEWRLAQEAPSKEAAELHYQASTLYKAQLNVLRERQQASN